MTWNPDRENSEDLPSARDTNSNGEFRFTTVHLMYLTAWLGASIAMFEEYAPVWLLGVCIFWAVAYFLRFGASGVVERSIVLILLFVFLACLGMPRVQRVREASRRTACINQLRQIGLAIMNYTSARLKYPSAYIADVDGKPMHSWRVQILQEIEQVGLYSAYDFDEPWDGPNNRLLIEQIGTWGPYACPVLDRDDHATPYKLVTGPGTVFEGEQSLSPTAITSTSNTILVIEDVGNPVCWMEPVDLTIDEAIQLFDLNAITKPYHVYETKFVRRAYYHRHVLMLDGSAQHVGWLEDPNQIIPYLLVDHPGKKSFRDLEFIYPEPEITILYSGFFLLGLNFFLAALPCFRKRLWPYRLVQLDNEPND